MRGYTPFLLAGLLVLVGCDAQAPRNTPNIDAALNANGATTGVETGASDLRTFKSEDELKSYLASMASTGFWSRGGTGAVEDGGGFDALAPPEGGGDNGPIPSPGLEEPDTGQVIDEGSGGDGPGFSDTTTQEEGVQEADIVKNDGTYLYVLTDGQLRIIQANPGDAMQETADVAVEGIGRELYKLPESAAVATRIVAIAKDDAVYGWDASLPPEIGVAQAEPLVEPDPGFDYPRPQVNVTVVDVSDHAQPAVQWSGTFEGTLLHSRMIDEVLYLVLVSYPEDFTTVLPRQTGGGVDPQDVDLDAVLPDYTIETASEAEATGNIVEWYRFFAPEDPDGFGITTIITLNVDHPTDFESVAVMAYPGDFYASTEAMYFTDTAYNFYTGDFRETTDVYKFAYTDGGVALTATGTVNGRVLNQYSMSEYEGYLRIATTTSGIWFGDAATPSLNHLYVLEEQNGGLDVAGSIENLAPGEEIKSARFIGPQGYLVTFEVIDPLITFDLSDPTNPVQKGELKVPGYSTFMVPMGADHLLTVGEDIVVDDWGWPISAGVQLSVFDVSDLADPRLVHKEVVGGEWSYSEAIYDPKAFTYFPAGDLLVLPIEDIGWVFEDVPGLTDGIVDPFEGEEGMEDSNGTEDEASQDGTPVESGFYGVYVYRVTSDEGFEYLGRLSTQGEEDDCGWSWSWFTRGVFMGDNVYAVNERGVSAAPVADVDSAPWRLVFPCAESPFDDVPSAPPDEPVGVDETPPSEDG